MKHKLQLVTLLWAVLVFSGCAPKVADLEQAFSDKITAAFKAKSFEQVKSLHRFQDETPELIEMLRENWERRFDHEIESIVYEAIPDVMKDRLSVGYENDGKWYRAEPSPYKLVRINFKKKVTEADGGSHWTAGMSKLVAKEGSQIFFPGMKLMDSVPKPIKIVLPNNYIGRFTIVWMESGIIPDENEESITYKIPDAGELEVGSLQFLMQDRPMILTYESGDVIYKNGEDESESDGIYFDPNSISTTAGNIGAPDGISGSDYYGTKLTWEIKKGEPTNQP